MSGATVVQVWPWPPPRPAPASVRHAEETIYVRKADRIAVRHRHGQIVAVVEIVSPGNKASKNELRTFRGENLGFDRAGHSPVGDRSSAAQQA